MLRVIDMLLLSRDNNVVRFLVKETFCERFSSLSLFFYIRYGYICLKENRTVDGRLMNGIVTECDVIIIV